MGFLFFAILVKREMIINLLLKNMSGRIQHKNNATLQFFIKKDCFPYATNPRNHSIGMGLLRKA